MSDFVVHRGTTAKLGRIEGELKIGNKARIEAAQGNLVYVSEGAYFDGSAEVNCDFECATLRVDHGGVLEVRGNLTVHKLLDVGHSIEATGTIRAEDIDVGGKIEAKTLIGSRLRVGGKVEVEELLEVESVNVGGVVEARGRVLIKDLDVGGAVEIGGGTISGHIIVGGKFEAQTKLEFGELNVFGRTELASGSVGSKISARGQLEVAGDLECDEILVSGSAEIQGNCKSKRIKVDGKLEVSGSLQTSDELEIYGTAEVNREFEGRKVRVGGKLETRKMVVSDELLVSGSIEADQGIKAKSVKIGSGSRVEGFLVAENVDVGKSPYLVDWEKSWMGQIARARLVGRMTRIDDIYADYVYLGTNSRSGRVFARTVEVGDGATVEEISYTDTLKANLDRIHVEKPPVKVSSLPSPPL
ncbi:MAG: polymer-forming cytoskeletal protein [Thaumarchaeota archaeon]|nr:polymer-forming cytoskeletal protein [Nitrososphaerota archaeon]